MSLLKIFKNVIETVVVDVVHKVICNHFNVRLRSCQTPNFSSSNIYELDWERHNGAHYNGYVKEILQSFLDDVEQYLKSREKQVNYFRMIFKELVVYNTGACGNTAQRAMFNVALGEENWSTQSDLEKFFAEIGEAHAEAAFQRLFEPIFSEIFEKMKEKRH